MAALLDLQKAIVTSDLQSFLTLKEFLDSIANETYILSRVRSTPPAPQPSPFHFHVGGFVSLSRTAVPRSAQLFASGFGSRAAVAAASRVIVSLQRSWKMSKLNFHNYAATATSATSLESGVDLSYDNTNDVDFNPCDYACELDLDKLSELLDTDWHSTTSMVHDNKTHGKSSSVTKERNIPGYSREHSNNVHSLMMKPYDPEATPTSSTVFDETMEPKFYELKSRPAPVEKMTQPDPSKPNLPSANGIAASVKPDQFDYSALLAELGMLYPEGYPTPPIYTGPPISEPFPSAYTSGTSYLDLSDQRSQSTMMSEQETHHRIPRQPPREESTISSSGYHSAGVSPKGVVAETPTVSQYFGHGNSAVPPAIQEPPSAGVLQSATQDNRRRISASYSGPQLTAYDTRIPIKVKSEDQVEVIMDVDPIVIAKAAHMSRSLDTKQPNRSASSPSFAHPYGTNNVGKVVDSSNTEAFRPRPLGRPPTLKTGSIPATRTGMKQMIDREWELQFREQERMKQQQTSSKANHLAPPQVNAVHSATQPVKKPAVNVTVPKQVMQVRTMLENPTRFHVETIREKQIHEYLGATTTTPEVPARTVEVQNTSSSFLTPRLGPEIQIDEVASEACTPGTVSPSVGSSGAPTPTRNDTDDPDVEDLLQEMIMDASFKMKDVNCLESLLSESGEMPNITHESTLTEADFKALMKDRQKKDNHNQIERKRRYHINDQIKVLKTLLPKSGEPRYAEAVRDAQEKGNKGAILTATVLYIKHLKEDSKKLSKMEERIRDQNKEKKKLLLKIQELETKLQESGISVPDRTWQPASSNEVMALLKDPPLKLFKTRLASTIFLE
ncbi:unnamed protein product [Cyprideis torosa]|uniref:Uncharacterized protein n=1 Tax=Cyprideis torosa TaxID=163714 RepID=A0A7R8W8J2_9CRUS|nr:unnamed protein product [Cyprideis torosa]CAG0886291.1 unnamed protein product [Cyprideis torosa]